MCGVVLIPSDSQLCEWLGSLTLVSQATYSLEVNKTFFQAEFFYKGVSLYQINKETFAVPLTDKVLEG